jgi:hypothetical protein
MGRQHVPERTQVLCANCHAIQSQRQLDDAVQLGQTQTALERMVAVTGVLGSDFLGLGEALLVLSQQGQTVIESLDRDDPHWRAKPWAK